MGGLEDNGIDVALVTCSCREQTR